MPLLNSLAPSLTIYFTFVFWNFKGGLTMRTTYMAKPADIEKKWYVVDATDKTLGRLASEIAKV